MFFRISLVVVVLAVEVDVLLVKVLVVELVVELVELLVDVEDVELLAKLEVVAVVDVLDATMKSPEKKQNVFLLRYDEELIVTEDSVESCHA